LQNKVVLYRQQTTINVQKLFLETFKWLFFLF